MAAPLLFFLFQIAGEPFKGNAEDAGEDGKLIVGHEAVAGLDAADGLPTKTNTADQHLGGEGILGKPLGRSRQMYSVAGDIGPPGVIIYFDKRYLLFCLTIPFFTDNLVIKIYII